MYLSPVTSASVFVAKIIIIKLNLGPCKHGLTLVNGECMQVHCLSKTWQEAKDHCESQNNHLARIMNGERNAGIVEKSLIKK